jgi:ribosomal protein S18 acetylase RimI-like enzyme
MVAGLKGELPEVAHQILTGPPEVRFGSIYQGTDLLAVGRGAVVAGYLQIALLQVAPAARRRGLASHLTRALAGWAATAGAHTAFLQVEEGNPPAIALYQAMGFQTHHRYLTRTQ